MGDTRYTTDARGQFTLSRGVPLNTDMDVEATGYLLRQTKLRAASGRSVTLWPSSTPTGLTAQLTQELAYTAAGTGPGGVGSPLGGARLQRLDPSITVVVVTASTLSLSQSGRAALEKAAANLNAATGGIITFTTSDVSGAARFDVVVDPARLTGRNAQAEPVRNAQGYITGGRITLASGTCVITECDLSARLQSGVTVIRTLTHEAGHLLGLGHTSDDRVMNGGCFTPPCSGFTYTAETFSAAEMSVIRLMLQRPAGNRFPDTDR